MDLMYSNCIYREIVEHATSPEMTQEHKALAIMNAAHALLKPRTAFFGGKDSVSLGPIRIFNTSRTVLIFGGACGDACHVLGRALLTAGLEIRLVQMKVGDVYGGHIVMEVLIDGRWVVFDPSCNLSFRNPDGSLATFAEIGDNLPYFQIQAPVIREGNLTFKELRRTNWEKIPIILPAVRMALDWTIGREAREGISLRAYLLNSWLNFIVLLSVLYLILVLWSVKLWRSGALSMD